MHTTAPWLLVHGAGGGGWEWQFWTKALRAQGEQAYAPTLALADRPLGEVQLQDYAAQLGALTTALPGPPIVVGASMGGLLALLLAERHPVRALGLINSVPPAGLAPAWQQAAPAFPPVIPWGDTASLESTRAAIPDADEATIAFAAARWRNESGQVMRALYQGCSVAPPRVPTLVVASGDDEDVPPTVSARLARWASADIVLLRAASHVGPLLGRRWHDAYRLTRAWCVGHGRR
jgi:pimeloyl-ACP methyl ester carboxylesterase